MSPVATRTRDQVHPHSCISSISELHTCNHTKIFTGHYYFQRLCVRADGSVIKLPSKSVVEADFLRQVAVKDWSEEFKEYIKLCNNGKLVESKQHIFMFESYMFQMYDYDTRYMTICVRKVFCQSPLKNVFITCTTPTDKCIV